jgi:uncharacterized membrane protein
MDRRSFAAPVVETAMKTRLLNMWDRLSGSFWFLPTFLVLTAAAMGFLFPIVDESHSDRITTVRWLATTPEGARTVLSVIAGGMITVAGVVFSMTMVTLSIASSQFGSRVLRRRMRNRATQLALGAFLGTSVFCLLVLRTVEEASGTTFVPHLSVSLGIVLAVASLFVLIFFIHDVAEAAQAPHVVARLAADLNDSIDRLFPEKIGEGHADAEDREEENERPRPGKPDRTVEADHEGYLVAIDGEGLMEAARQSDLLIELCVRPGDFITAGCPVARIRGAAEESPRFVQRVNDALIVGNMRTPRQDVNCAIHELAQLTVRALSPGINDPFTAMNGIDRLSAALGRLAEREMPSKYRTDPDGRLRVVVDRVTFPEALAAAFNQIRQHARSTPTVGIRLLEGLESIARKARRESDAEAILEQAKRILEACQNADCLQADLQGMEEQFGRVQSVLKEGDAEMPG